MTFYDQDSDDEWDLALAKKMEWARRAFGPVTDSPHVTPEEMQNLVAYMYGTHPSAPKAIEPEVVETEISQDLIDFLAAEIECYQVEQQIRSARIEGHV